jgi:murein DD-endopeptidase MepM/ murein hydrolase activator NlpD
MNNKFLQYPFKKPIMLNQRFGNKYKIYTDLGMTGHNGLDFMCPTGTPILAMHNGTVSYARFDKGGGNMIEILSDEKRDFGKLNVRYKTLYAHLDRMDVKEGDCVRKGQVIGMSGNTGQYTTGAHLHNALKLVDDSGDTINGRDGFLGAIDHLPFIDFNWKLNFTGTLQRGSKGEAVLNIQDILIKLGYFNPKDKYPFYGGKTNNAVRNLQMLLIGEENFSRAYTNDEWARGLSIVGPQTRELLTKLSN